MYLRAHAIRHVHGHAFVYLCREDFIEIRYFPAASVARGPTRQLGENTQISSFVSRATRPKIFRSIYRESRKGRRKVATENSSAERNPGKKMLKQQERTKPRAVSMELVSEP